MGALDNNGGPARTHALLPSSPAIDADDSGGCAWDYDNNTGTPEAALTQDQRGAQRPTDGDGTPGARCDIGAFEYPNVEASDFNGDRKSDILWCHTSGLIVVWLMDGSAVTSAVSLGGDMSWTVVP
ncbi:MAG: hypothetical protein AMS22_05525 [Thiotrichales bacterium SG8_50]|nr:MAG: hypothetical protein AMS22_05525 [Thiotrichales bacterium SG8_50]